MVLATYVQLYQEYTRAYSEYDKRRVWAIWYHRSTAWIVVLSGGLSAVGFVYYSCVQIATLEPEASWPWGLYGYVLFLVFSALYAPLLGCARAGWTGAHAGVIAALLGVACSAVTLCAWTRTRWTWAEAPALNLSVTWLAVHCTLLDLGLWGCAWWNGFVWASADYEERVHDEDGEGVGGAYEDPRLMIGNV